MTSYLSQEEATALLNQGGLVVDVRTSEEYSAAHVPNSLNLPLHLIPVLAQEKITKEQPILLCCASGARSAMALEFLKSQGYEAYNLGSWISHPDFS